jgi:TPR repeat protein
MSCVLRIGLCAAIMTVGCRRPEPEDQRAWEKNPGLDPHSTGQTLKGRIGPALQDVTFRLDPARGTAAKTARSQSAETEDDLYLQAARSGQAWAQVKLGTKYVAQSGDLARLGEGLHWLNAAADQNNTEALRVLAALSMEGRGVDQSEKQAYKYIRRAAELGSPEAQYELSNMLAGGQGLGRDPEAALVWGKKAARQGYAPAQFTVGRMLVNSVERERKNEGVDFLQRAADSGHIGALLMLSTALARGEFGLEKDESRAEELLKTYAENGNADCQFALASLYRNGETFAKRRSEALEWLRRAAAGGNRQAAEILGKMETPPSP